MPNNIKINIKKSGISLDSLLKAFNEQKIISIELCSFSGIGPHITETQNIFVTKFEWINDDDFIMRFVTLFKSEGMIPGTYELESNKRDFVKGNQEFAQLCQNGPVRK